MPSARLQLAIPLLGLAFTAPLLAQNEHESKATRQESGFDALCAIESPAVPTRQFDPRRLVVDAAVTPEQELESIAAALSEPAVQGWGWRRIYDEDVQGRLALFPWRFGVEPTDVAGWPAVESAAAQLLEVVVAEGSAFASTANNTHAQLLEVLLLDLSGHRAEADERLGSMTITYRGCGNCREGREDSLASARAVLAERSGQIEIAIDLLEESLSDDYNPAVQLSSDAEAARYGLLQLLGGRADRGVCVLQRLVDLRPGTPGAEVARAALEQIGALRVPTAERLRTLYLDASDVHKELRALAIAALGAHRFRESYAALLEAQLAGERGALAALARLRDERCRELFELTLAHKDTDDVATALEGLDGLEGGARGYVASALRSQQRFHGDGRYHGRYRLDKALRSICGGGPDQADVLDATTEQYFADWFAWLSAHGLGEFGPP